MRETPTRPARLDEGPRTTGSARPRLRRRRSLFARVRPEAVPRAPRRALRVWRPEGGGGRSKRNEISRALRFQRSSVDQQQQHARRLGSSSARPKNALSSSRDGSKSPPGRHSGRRGRDDRTRAMTEQKEEPKKNVAVDLECDDEFEEFGNEGAWRPPASQISPSIPPSPRRINPKRALTHTRPAFRPRRVGSRGGGRRGRQPVGGGLGRHRDQRRLHQAAPRRARALRPVMRTRSGGAGRRVPRGPDRREALHRPFETRGM